MEDFSDILFGFFQKSLIALSKKFSFRPFYDYQRVKESGCGLLIKILSFFIIVFYIIVLIFIPEVYYEVGKQIKIYYTEIYDLGKEQLKFKYNNENQNQYEYLKYENIKSERKKFSDL